MGVEHAAIEDFMTPPVNDGGQNLYPDSRDTPAERHSKERKLFVFSSIELERSNDLKIGEKRVT
jgi:hypothetical protein